MCCCDNGSSETIYRGNCFCDAWSNVGRSVSGEEVADAWDHANELVAVAQSSGFGNAGLPMEVLLTHAGEGERVVKHITFPMQIGATSYPAH